jgi:ABC-type Fe3+/spermidine/putrescine transport system ATPase subunit
VFALVRPEAVRLTPEDGAEARVVAVSFLGSVCRVQVELPGRELVGAQTSAEAAMRLSPGTAVRVGVQAAAIFAVEDGGTARP